MKKGNFQFWMYFAVGWLFYAASLAAIFAGQDDFDRRGVVLAVVYNVLPAVLLGIAAVKICEKIEWRKSSRFILSHLFLAFAFAFLWGFLTLLLGSLHAFLQSGEWRFIVWNNYALQWQLFSGLMAYFTIASGVYIRRFNGNLRLEEQRNAELQILAAKAESARRAAELFALRSQLNPHFLFNALHSLMALTRTDAKAAEAAIERFSEMLRYVLRSQTDAGERDLDVSLGEELAFIENYLELEKMRLGERLRVKTEIEEGVSACRIPAFSIQPLVENAVNRGVSPKAAGGEILLEAFRRNGFLQVVVTDDGAGANVEEVLRAKGLGLRLIREMLAAKYGEKAVLEIETAPNKGFTATLKIPQEK